MKAIKYIAKNTGNNGWTVVEREGSKRTGYTERQVSGAGLTAHTASAIATTMNSDFSRHGVRAA